MELKINYELIIKYLSKKSEKVDIHQKCNTQQRTDISFNKNNTFSKANTIVKTSLDSKSNLVKTSLDSEAIELYPNVPTNNMFITQQNIFNYSINFPEIFKLIFNEKFYRYGIKNYDNDNNNISFWSSLLILIDKEYLIPYDNDELGMINQFKNQLLEKYTKRKNDISSFIKKLDKNNLRERFKLIPDINVLQYVADILEINLVIFNFETNKIEIVYPTNTINPFKQFLLFAKHNIFWEPIMLTKSKGVIQRLFTYNDVIIKKILTENQIEYLDGNIINKTYTFSNNFVSIIQQEKNKICPTILLSSTENTEESENNSVHTESDIFIESDINNDIKGINKTKLNKMKLAELLELSTKLKIETKKNSTRSILIDLIITKIKSNI